MQTRTIEVIDLVQIGKKLPDGFYTELLDFINNSDISFGNNDDTLVRSDNFVIMMEEVVSNMADEHNYLTKSEAKKVNLVIDFLKRNSGCMVALGS